MAERGNPDLDQTAARHVARALSRVHPRQRAEVLTRIIHHATAGLATIATGSAEGLHPKDRV